MTPIFDTHCHYNLEPLYSGQPGYFNQSKLGSLAQMNWQDHWQQAQQKGIVAAVVPGTSLELTKKAIEIAQAQSNLYASAAFHPDRAKQDWNQDWGQLTQLAAHSQIIAIGETGLDYYHIQGTAKEQVRIKKRQQQLFQAHLNLANQLDLPVVIHARGKNKSEEKLNSNKQNSSEIKNELMGEKKSNQVYQDILNLLQEHYQFNRPFILHCVSGPQDYIVKCLELGGYISVAGNVTYPNAQDLQELVRLTPADRLLVETDTPFLAPQTQRGKINQPWMIADTVKFLQDQLKIDPEQLVVNAQRVFDLENW
ncbi:MAG: hypothetical protein GF381_03185 [Candidatus Pacebacteria bacterium]|nr:hypothetical protein [Candidatus Paceibacterota bacterium]